MVIIMLMDNNVPFKERYKVKKRLRCSLSDPHQVDLRLPRMADVSEKEATRLHTHISPI